MTAFDLHVSLESHRSNKNSFPSVLVPPTLPPSWGYLYLPPSHIHPILGLMSSFSTSCFIFLFWWSIYMSELSLLRNSH